MIPTQFDYVAPSSVQEALVVLAEHGDEAKVLARHAKDRNVQRTPDTSYRPVTKAAAGTPRPVVIGAGPCGLFAGLILAQMGFRPIILDRGKVAAAGPRDDVLKSVAVN